jgi:hypothetical protein
MICGLPLAILRSPPIEVVRVWMMGNSTKILMLFPNIQNMKIVMKICDLDAVATSNSF